MRALPVLGTWIGSLSGYDLRVFGVVQHGSTLLGLPLLARWTIRWARNASVSGSAPPPALPPLVRALVLVSLVAGAAAVAFTVSSKHLPGRISLGSLQPYVGDLARSGLQSLCVGIVLYAAAWHAWRRG